MKKVIVIAAFAAAVAVAGCRSGEPAPLGAGSSFGTLVFRQDLASSEKVSYIRSQALWDPETQTLLFSRPNNNFWTFDAVTNVNLTLPGREVDLVNLYETKYGPWEAPQE